jgi:lipoprotein signal peptidase
MRHWLVLALILVDWLSKEFFSDLGMVVLNRGSSFGFVDSVFLPVLSLGLSLFFLITWLKETSRSGLAFLMAGAWGNTIDRMLFGAVRDFIQYPFIDLTGNLADIYLVVGLGLLVWEGYNTAYAKRRD